LPAILPHVLFLLFPLLVALGAVSDALTMTIPDRLALALFGGFVLLAPVAGLDWASVALHCAAAAVVLAGAFGLFACGWIGGGDGKFAAAIALWLGWSHLLAFMAATAIFGGVLALAILVVRFRHLPPLAAPVRANVGIKRTTSNILNRVELLNLTFEHESGRDRDSNVEFARLSLRRWSTVAAAVRVAPSFPCLSDPDAGLPVAVALAAAALLVYPHSIWIGLAAG
jgi:prepilin peptidase CpaA